MDQANRLLQGFKQTPAEEITDGREVRRGFWRADLPFSHAIRLRFRLRSFLQSEHSEQRIIRSLNFVPRILGATEGKLHIRLPGRHPHFAHRDVLHLQSIVPRNRNIADRSRLQPIQLRVPTAIRIRSGLHGLVLEFHDHLFTRIGRAPDIRGRLLLKHHIVGNQRGKFDIRKRRRGEKSGNNRETKRFQE